MIQAKGGIMLVTAMQLLLTLNKRTGMDLALKNAPDYFCVDGCSYCQDDETPVQEVSALLDAIPQRHTTVVVMASCCGTFTHRVQEHLHRRHPDLTLTFLEHRDYCDRGCKWAFTLLAEDLRRHKVLRNA